MNILSSKNMRLGLWLIAILGSGCNSATERKGKLGKSSNASNVGLAIKPSQDVTRTQAQQDEFVKICKELADGVALKTSIKLQKECNEYNASHTNVLQSTSTQTVDDSSQMNIVTDAATCLASAGANAVFVASSKTCYKSINDIQLQLDCNDVSVRGYFLGQAAPVNTDIQIGTTTNTEVLTNPTVVVDTSTTTLTSVATSATSVSTDVLALAKGVVCYKSLNALPQTVCSAMGFIWDADSGKCFRSLDDVDLQKDCVDNGGIWSISGANAGACYKSYSEIISQSACESIVPYSGFWNGTTCVKGAIPQLR